VPSALADKVLENRVSNIGTAGQTFARIYARELAESLSEPERICATLKVLGWSSAEIGKHLKMKASAVDKLMQRLRDRCQGNLANGRKPPSGGESS
jgi:DNA-directed RNA polymerase specialized sigma24 family protein